MGAVYPTDFVFRVLESRPVRFHPLLDSVERERLNSIENEGSEEIEWILEHLQTYAPLFAWAENEIVAKSSLKSKKVTIAPKSTVKIYDPDEYALREKEFTVDTLLDVRYLKERSGYCRRNPKGPSLKTDLVACKANLQRSVSTCSLNNWSRAVAMQLGQFIAQEIADRIAKRDSLEAATEQDVCLDQVLKEIQSAKQGACFDHGLEETQFTMHTVCLDQFLKDIQFSQVMMTIHEILLDIGNDIESCKLPSSFEVGKKELMRRFQSLNTKLICELVESGPVDAKKFAAAGVISMKKMNFYLDVLNSVEFDALNPDVN